MQPFISEKCKNIKIKKRCVEVWFKKPDGTRRETVGKGPPTIRTARAPWTHAASACPVREEGPERGACGGIRGMHLGAPAFARRVGAVVVAAHAAVA